MTIGEKIRNLRIFRKLTQKELGLKLGFSTSTADVRIRQYESNKMVTKSKKLAQIASALDVDISALSDINITSINDVMHIFFELEDTLGLRIDENNNQYILSFDNLEKKNKDLLIALDEWHNARMKSLPILSDNDDSIAEKKKEYTLWKQRYPIDTRAKEFLTDRDDEI